jgi:hypothetical protein
LEQLGGGLSGNAVQELDTWLLWKLLEERHTAPRLHVTFMKYLLKYSKRGCEYRLSNCEVFSAHRVFRQTGIDVSTVLFAEKHYQA